MSGKKHAGGDRPDETLKENETDQPQLAETTQRLKFVERVANLGSWELDVATRQIVWSEEFFRICGFKPGKVKPTFEAWLNQIHPDDRESSKKVLEQAIASNSTFSKEIRIIRLDGSVIWVDSKGEVVSDSLGKPVKVIGSFLEISARKQAEALQEAAYKIALATETTESLDELFSRIHEIISFVMPAENLYITLYDEERNAMRFPYFKDELDKPYLGEVEPGKGLTAYVLRTGKSLLCTQEIHDRLQQQGEIKLVGVPSAIWLGVPLAIEKKVIGAVVVQHYTDPNAYGVREQRMLEFVSTQVALAISRKQTEDKLKQLSTHDILTGLYNRGFFEEEMERIERGRLFPVSVVMADVDHLKEINDSRGHDAGDSLLKRVSQVLTTAFRSEDIIARIGGDEFAVLLPNTNTSVAEKILIRTRYVLETHNASYPDAPLQLSIGVYTAEKSTPLAEALKEADKRMYSEKQKHYVSK